MLVKLSPGANFIKLFAKQKLAVHSFGQKFAHSISKTFGFKRHRWYLPNLWGLKSFSSSAHKKKPGAFVDEIDTRCQCHQLSSFFVWKCFAQVFSNYSLAFVIFWWNNISAKAAHKMLVKLTTGHLLSLVVPSQKKKNLVTFEFDIWQWEDNERPVNYFELFNTFLN
jgi:hypothetical protein